MLVNYFVDFMTHSQPILNASSHQALMLVLTILCRALLSFLSWNYSPTLPTSHILRPSSFQTAGLFVPGVSLSHWVQI